MSEKKYDDLKSAQVNALRKLRNLHASLVTLTQSVEDVTAFMNAVGGEIGKLDEAESKKDKIPPS